MKRERFVGRYIDRRLGDLVIAGLAVVCVCTPLQAHAEPVRSTDGRRMAYTVARGGPGR